MSLASLVFTNPIRGSFVNSISWFTNPPNGISLQLYVAGDQQNKDLGKISSKQVVTNSHHYDNVLQTSLQMSLAVLDVLDLFV